MIETGTGSTDPLAARMAGLDRQALVRLAARFCRDRGEAEDAVHDALLAAAERAGQLQRPERWLSWLKSIVVRRALDLNRRTARRRQVETALTLRGGSAAVPPLTGELDDLAHALREVIAELPERQRVAIVLRHLEGCAYGEVAQMMGVQESTVRVLVRLAREGLQAALIARGQGHLLEEKA